LLPSPNHLETSLPVMIRRCTHPNFSSRPLLAPPFHSRQREWLGDRLIICRFLSLPGTAFLSSVFSSGHGNWLLSTKGRLPVSFLLSPSPPLSSCSFLPSAGSRGQVSLIGPFLLGNELSAQSVSMPSPIPPFPKSLGRITSTLKQFLPVLSSPLTVT